jgi:hypothetical protein
VGITRAPLGSIEIEEGESLGEDKQVLRAPGAGQGQGHLRRIFLTAGVAENSQGKRVTLARDNGPDKALPSGPGDITEHV